MSVMKRSDRVRRTIRGYGAPGPSDGQIDEAYDKANELLSKRRALLEQGARLLVEKEVITRRIFLPCSQVQSSEAK
jgi:hypothetical protein